MTCPNHKVREESDDGAGEPIEDQQEAIVARTGLELVRL